MGSVILSGPGPLPHVTFERLGRASAASLMKVFGSHSRWSCEAGFGNQELCRRLVVQLGFGFRSRFVVVAASVGMAMVSTSHSAQAQVPVATARAMPGLIHVGLPAAPENTLAVSAGAGIGLLDAAQNTNPGSRLLGNVAGAFSLDPHWLVGLDFSGQRDRFGDEANGYGEPRLTGRYLGDAMGPHHWGVQLDARLIGAQVPSIELSATSPSVRAMYGLSPNQNLWLGAELGFDLNRTADAIPGVARLSANDRRSLNASSWSGLPWGVGASYRLIEGTSLITELSGEWLIGSESPGFTASPVRLSAALQQWFGDNLLGSVGADLALSERAALARDQIAVEEPRISGFLGLTWVLAKPPPPTRAPAAPPKPAPAPVVVKPVAPAPAPGPAVSPVSGTVVDEGGRPLPDVEVVLERGDEPPRSARTFDDGHFEFEAVPEGAVTLQVTSAGFESVSVELEADKPRSPEIMLRPAVPAGQVRGKVLDLQGNPVVAKVTILGDASNKADELSVVVAADGSFELDLAPGRYVVRLEHPDFAPQRRNVVVKDKGVVILNIALIR